MHKSMAFPPYVGLAAVSGPPPYCLIDGFPNTATAAM